MRQYFAEMPYQSFPLLSLPHLTALAVIALVCLFLAVFRRRLCAAERGGLAGSAPGRFFWRFW